MDAFSFLQVELRKALRNAGRPSRLLVGVSGGADSVALLMTVCAWRDEVAKNGSHSLTVAALHVQHDLRDAAKEDAAFVQALCERLQVPCFLERVHVPRDGSVEDAARQVRYQAFGRVYQAFHADALLLAHHMDDQAETVLMHLVYGGGAAGLSGMREKTQRGGMLLLRPFLSVSRLQILSALEHLHQPFRTDESNADTHYTRNFLRAEVLPKIETRFPSAAQSCARAAAILADEDDYLSRLTQDFLSVNACLRPPCRFMLRAPLVRLPVALQRRALRAMCGELSFEKTEELRSALTTVGAVVNLPKGGQALVTRERLHIINAEKQAQDAPQLAVSPYAGDRGDGLRSQVISKALLERAALRFRQSGDFLIPFGQAGTKPLKEYLIDKKIDRPFREHLPLLCIGSEVLMVFGVGASERLRVSPAQEQVLVRLTSRLPYDL